MMKRINFYEEEVEIEVLGEVNHYEESYMKEWDDYIKEEGLQDLKEILIRY